MNNETDLDWLARNVHEWPYGAAFVRIHTNGQEAVFITKSGSGLGGNAFNNDQWTARRAELQNKPSWNDAPEWATHLAQNGRGQWWFMLNGKLLGDSGRYFESDRSTIEVARGEVLGDWRDTLEHRPENPRTELEVELVKAAFEPFTSIEDNQEKKMQQDNGWFERGELPPVGVVCETLAEPELSWVEAEVLAHRDGFAIVWVVSEKCGAQCDTPGHFRPIRTERELAVEEMKQHCPYHGDWDTVGRIYAEALYDAGYRKESK